MMKKRTILLTCSMLIGILLNASLLFAADPAQYGTPFSGVPDRSDVVIYQVNMRSFSSTRNLQGVINRLDNIKALGVNVIQIMPVQPVATLNAFNSPYAWKDFVTVGAEYGSLTTLRALVDGAHARGMAVIMDWVANQTGWDHPWITAHKDWFVQNSSGVIQSLNGWTDVAALNMNSAAMKTEMINCLRYWVFAANIDGFRVDYANNAPTWWTSVISNLRGITTHKLLMVAEGDATGLFGAGFDMTFSWNFYGNVKSIYGGSAATVINTANTSDYSGATGTQQVVRWLSNHDIYGSEGSPYSVLGGKNSTLAFFAVTAYMKSVPFIYNGMEVGCTTSMPFPFTGSTINWTQDVSVTPIMTQIIAFRNSNVAIRRGTLTSYTTSNVCAFKKVSGTETAFVLVNLRNSSQTFTLPSGIASTTMIDGYTNSSVSLGTSITLSAYQHRVFKNGTTTTVPVTGVTMNPTSATVGVNGTAQLTATVAPSNATNKSVTWTSNNTAIATVSTTGLVTGKAAGSATITVTTADGARTATCAITVTSTTVAVTGVTMSPTSATVGVNGTSQLTATVAPSNATNKSVTWTSNNTAIATVSTAGLVTGKAAGTATITVTTVDGARTATCAVTVTASATTYYSIKNRWKNTFLYDAGTNVGYGTTVADNNYLWEKVSIDATYFYLKNAGTGQYMHIEGQTGSVQCDAGNLTWTRQQWSQVAVDATWSRIVNRGQTTSMIHVEGQTGSAQYSGAQTGWWSAHWQLTATALKSADGDAIESLTGMVVYPNPVSNGYVFVELTGTQETSTIQIFDMNGRMIYQVASDENEIKLNTNELHSGIYFVKAMTSQGVLIQKLVKQ